MLARALAAVHPAKTRVTDRSLQLILGADGAIGCSLMRHFRNEGRPVLGTTRRPDCLEDQMLHVDLADVTLDWDALEAVETVWLCASVTSIAECDSRPDQTRAVNVDGVCQVAEKLSEVGAQIVFLSSSLVFDGRAPFYCPDSQVCPRTEYGRQKVEVEQRLGSMNPVVIRLTKVLGPQHPLLMGWQTSLQEGRVIRPYSDRVIAPLPLDWVVRALPQLVDLPGIHHLSGDQDISWSLVGEALAEHLGADLSLVQPVEIGQPEGVLEPVGKYATLDMSATLKALDLTQPSLGDLFNNWGR